MWTLHTLATDTHGHATVPGVTERDKTITVGRYQLHRKIARGGMATIHIAHLVGDVGFSRIVAAKRLHPELAQDRDFVAMFLDEARIASRVHHRNVVPVLDVVTMRDEVILVQDFVHGVPLSWLQKELAEAQLRVPVPIAVAIACQVLAGLHAAHETTDELGTPLQIVHRDVSPQNVMIATDGSARLLDFGVAKAAMAAHVTRAGMFKGKIAYAAPEQIRGRATQQSDIYAVAVMLWEMLTGRRLNPSSQGQTAQIAKILRGEIATVTDTLAEERAWLGDSWSHLEALQDVLDRGLAHDPLQRWATALDMEVALAAAVSPAAPSEIAAWVRSVGKTFIEERDQMIAAEEASWRRMLSSAATVGPPPAPPRAKTTAEQPPITATEPPPTSIRPSFLNRPIALLAACALLGVLLAFGIVFLGRDIDAADHAVAAQPEPRVDAPEHTVARPPEPAPATVRAPEPVRRETPAVTIAAPPPQPAPRPVPKAAPSPPPIRRVVVRASPPPPPKAKPARVETPPVPAAAPVPDRKAACSPPYYYEGDKKIFKPACV